MEFRNVTGYARPKAIEITKHTVYLRKNIQTAKDNDDNDCFTYDEAQLTHEQYQKYQEAITYLSLYGMDGRFEAVEQEVTDTEITNMRQEQSITDNEMAIAKLTDKVGSTTADTKEA